MTTPICILAEEAPEYPARPDLAVTALIHLLAGYPARPCSRRADAILAHLMLVARDDRQPEELRQVVAQAAAAWRKRIAQSQQVASQLLH